MQAFGAIRRMIFGFVVLVVPSYKVTLAETVIFNCQFGDFRVRLEIDDRAKNVTRRVVGANGIPSLTRTSPADFSGDHVRWQESSRTLSIEFTLNLRSRNVIFKSEDSRGGVFGGQIEGCERTLKL